MRFPTLICPLLLLASFSAQADLPIAIPSPAADVSTTYGVGVDSISAGAVQIKSLTGATYTVGKSSSASLTETAQGELSLKYTLLYGTRDSAYGTTAGLLLPIVPSWKAKDLSLAKSITFQIKAAVPGVTVHLIIGSPNYPADVVAAGAAFVSFATVTLTDSFQTVTMIPWTDFALPGWLTTADRDSVAWIADGYNTTYSLGTAVTNLNFQPILDSAWDSTGTGFKPGTSAITSNTITIRNVDIPGIGDPVPVKGSGCTGTGGVIVEDFAPTKRILAQNYLGGSWYAYSDTSSDPAKLNDSAVGSSTILLPAGEKAWTPDESLAALVTATLEKDVPTSVYLYHRYAGWAGIGTTLPGGNPDGSLDLQPGPAPCGGALTAISFDLYAGRALGGSYTVDTTNIRRILFKVAKASVRDAASYSVSIPVSQATSTSNNNICVDATLLQQPNWYVTDSLNGTAIPFRANDLTKLSWQIQIEDQADPTKHTSANNTISVDNVKFYGVDCVEGIEGSHSRATGLRATYAGALQLSYAVDGTAAQIDVQRLDGARIASFRNAATVRDLSLPVALSHGTYLVSVQGSRTRQVALLSVVR